MHRIIEEQLKDGRHLELHCMKYPGNEETPVWVRNLFGAPLCNGWGGRTDDNDDSTRYLAVYGWEKYYYDMFMGATEGTTTDFLYAASVDGEPAGRVWFGYSNHSGCGNFGNVVTFPRFRKQGIMSLALQEVARDFSESSARFISCGADPGAAFGYASIGFQRIISPEDHLMALVKPEYGSFADVVEMAYSKTKNALIRPGTRGDRHDIDKLLSYTRPIYLNHSSGNPFLSLIPDYMRAYNRLKPGTSSLYVLESCMGFCAAYAYAWKCQPGIIAVIFSIYPSFSAYLPGLIQQTTQNMEGRILACPCVICPEYAPVLQKSGYREQLFGMFVK